MRCVHWLSDPEEEEAACSEGDDHIDWTVRTISGVASVVVVDCG